MIATVIAILCVGAAALWLHPDQRTQTLGEAGLALLAGLIALGLALRGQPPSSAAQLYAAPERRSRVRWRLFGLGLVCLALVAENNAMRFAPAAFDYMSYHIQFALFAGGIAALAAACYDPPRGERIAADEWLLIGLLFTAALIPRVVGLDTLVRTLVDEGPWVDGVRNLWWRGDYELLRPMSSVFPFSSIFPYWEAAAVEILGNNLVGLRFASSLTGAMTVIALYALARHLFDRPTALMAALILAFFPPHVHFSRLALLNMVDPLPGTLALAWAVRGLRYGRRFDWALAGVALGMTHYFFEAGRLLFTPLMIVWFGWLWLFRPSLLDGRRRNILIMFALALLVALPFYYVLTAQGGALAGRLDQSMMDFDLVRNVVAGNRPLEDLARQLLTPLLMYVSRAESAAYYAGDHPLVLTGVVPLLLLGAYHVLLRPRRPAILLLIWPLAAAAGNVLLKDPAVSARYVVALPALALLIALGLRETVALLVRFIGRPGLTTWLRRAAAAAVVVLGVMHTIYYFGPHIDRFNVQNRAIKLYRDGVDAVLRSVNLSRNTWVILISEPVHDANVPGHFLGFLRPDMQLSAVTPQEVTHRMLADLPTDRPYAFYIAIDDAHSLNLLRHYFYLQPPRITPFYDDVPPDKQYILYYAPLGSARIVERIKPTPLQVFTPAERAPTDDEAG